MPGVKMANRKERRRSSQAIQKRALRPWRKFKAQTAAARRRHFRHAEPVRPGKVGGAKALGAAGRSPAVAAGLDLWGGGVSSPLPPTPDLRQWGQRGSRGLGGPREQGRG